MMKQNKLKHPKRPLKAVKALPLTFRQLDDTAEPQQVLRFTPWAWAKLQFFCHHGDTEIGGFGVTSEADLLLIEDFITVKQETSCVSVAFDDEAVADFFESQVDAGRKPEQFARCWCHTHPGDSPNPSGIDEETFNRVFGKCDWAVMFILARSGATYARLRFNIGPRGEMLIPTQVDYSVPFGASAHEAWKQEYDANIHPVRLPSVTSDVAGDNSGESPGGFGGGNEYCDWLEDFPLEELDPTVEAELLRQFEDMEFGEHYLEENEVIL